jgi:mRNA interferase HigB
MSDWFKAREACYIIAYLYVTRKIVGKPTSCKFPFIFIGRYSMNTISRRKIREFIALQPNSESSLNSWYKIATKAKWKNIIEVKQDYPHANSVGRLVVFNIAGNNVRLIVEIRYQSESILIKHILTHAEYDKNRWKE